MFNKSTHREKINPGYIYPTTHDAVLHILKSREIAKTDSELAVISASSFASTRSDIASTLSLKLDQDKYEKLDDVEAAEAAGLTNRVYLKKKDDYDIINVMTSAI